MKFKGNSLQMQSWFDALIRIFGKDAKIADIEKCVIAHLGGEQDEYRIHPYLSSYLIYIMDSWTTYYS